MLKQLFEDIKTNKQNYSNSRDGDQFEQWFKTKSRAWGFSEIIQRTNTNSAIETISNLENITIDKSKLIFNNLKKRVLEKNSMEIIDNPYQNINNTFIFQPYGTQDFPDFLFFVNGKVVPIEIKYSKNPNRNKEVNSARPMWNSNMPKPNAIYIYGLANELVTFFKGSSILNFDTREVLLNFFANLEKGEEVLDQELEDLQNNFGIYPYIRKAYEHKKTKSTFLDVCGNKVIESYFSENAEDRENEVIAFFEEIENEQP